MNKQVSLLIELQHTDSSLDRILTKKKELPEKKSALWEGLKQAEAKFENEKNRLDEAAKVHRQKEEIMKRDIEHLKKTKDRLLEVKTNKEYQAMLKEIESIEKKNSEHEDEIIYALDEIDQAKKEIKEREKELADYRKAYESDMAIIESELSTIDQEFDTITTKKEHLQAEIGHDLLKRYEVIKSRRNGRAVVSVWKGICDGCHMQLPPQMYIELQKSDDMFQCPFCTRIIYWDRNRNE